jgi:hypothetical protein
MDDKTFGHGFLAFILTRAVLQFSRPSPNMVSRRPSFRFEFLFSIKIFAFALHSRWNSQGPSRIGSASYGVNSPQNLESDISIEPAICEAKASRFCRNSSMVRRVPALSRNRPPCKVFNIDPASPSVAGRSRNA